MGGVGVVDDFADFSDEEGLIETFGVVGEGDEGKLGLFGFLDGCG